MKKASVSVGCALTAVVALAAPHVDQHEVTFTQNGSRVATIAYTLEDEPAVITMEIQTNTLDNAEGVWVTVPELCDFRGDVNKRVDVGESTITWNPVEEWPGKAIKHGKVRALVTAWPTNNPPDVVVVDLPTGDVMFFRSLDALPGGPQADAYKVNKLVMKRCHAAGVPFRMGATDVEEGSNNRSDSTYSFEKARMGTLSADFYMGLYEFTLGQYNALWNGTEQAVTDANKTPKLDRSWNNLRGNCSPGQANDWPAKGHAVAANSDLGKLRERVGNVLEFDLPTSAQWEFACRAGSQLPYTNGARYDKPNPPSKCGRDASWNSTNTSTVMPVGTVTETVNPFNAWGFSDMLGNVRELVLDHMTNEPYLYDFENGAATSGGHQYITSDTRVIRGGCFAQEGKKCRTSSISDWGNNNGCGDYVGRSGFRVCMPAVIR